MLNSGNSDKFTVFMRIDKFLWCVRIYKTRSIASEELKKNRVSVDGKLVKQSKDVMPGETLQVKKNQITYTYRILQIPKSRLGAKLVAEHIQDRTAPEELEKLKLRQLERSYYRDNEGKPTRRDRKEIQEFMAQDTDWDDFFSEDDEDEDILVDDFFDDESEEE